MAKISVILADDHTVVRQALKSLLSADPDINVVGEAKNGRQAVQMCRDLRPDIVVMDIAMPQLNGLEATRQIIRDKLPTKVLILSSYDDCEHVQRLTEAGVAGYLVKQTAIGDLIEAIHEVFKGNAYFSPLVARRILDFYQDALLKGKPLYRPKERLTSRGLEVLQLIAEGTLSKQIASDLKIGIKAVEKHRQQVMDTLNIHDIPGLTRYAVARGMIEVSPHLDSRTGRARPEPALPLVTPVLPVP